MNDGDHELFEAELRKLAPARPPAEFMARLAAGCRQPSGLDAQINLAAALSLAGAAAWRRRWRRLCWSGGAVQARAERAERQAGVGPRPDTAPRADNVEIDQQLVAAFDAVARLPDGQPVRFRCREWADAVVLRTPPVAS